MPLPGSGHLRYEKAKGPCRGTVRQGPSFTWPEACARLALVLGGGVAAGLGGELALLQFDVGGHALVGVAVRKVEHRVVERMEAGQCDELELVAHVPELA